jgi:UDP:flavonoid glycosyltransferase YjiC (YdhE family)
MSTVVRAAAGLDVEVVLVRPDRRTARRELPPNVRTSDWLPLPDVLDASTAVIHHGGAGTVLAAFAAGVPQLVVPGAGDRRHNAERVKERGAGLALDARQITPTALDSLVRDDRLAETAQEVRREILAMPSPTTVAPRLQRLVEEGPHPTRR